MNAPHKFPADATPAFAAYPSWPLRLAAFRDTHLAACLASIRDDADRAGDAEWAYEAQYALDSGDLTELDDLIARDAEAEREADRAYRFECRAGREWAA